MASTVPTSIIGLADTGRIAAGAVADLTLWSSAMEVVATIVGGDVAYRR
jgi:N-acetylglucosamine-6-phosphate deacetylase